MSDKAAEASAELRPVPGTGSGSIRLEGELTAFEAEFENLVETAEAIAKESAAEPDSDDETAAPASWISRGRELITKADSALRDGNIERGWHYLHVAKRIKTYGLEAADESGTLHDEAMQILAESRNSALKWRADAIEDQLATTDGVLKDDLTWSDVRLARELLQEGHERYHLKRQHLQTQFRYLLYGAGVTVILFLLVSGISEFTALLPSPFVAFPEAGADLGKDAGVAIGFLVYIVLAGMLGGALFGLRSLRRRTTSTSTPQHLDAREASLARMVVGAGSALAIFFFLLSDLVNLGSVSISNLGPFLIALAFVSGYSERFAHSSIEAVASVTEPESANGE